MRMQIRRLVSESRRRCRGRKPGHQTLNGLSIPEGNKSQNKPSIDTIFHNTNANYPRLQVTRASVDATCSRSDDWGDAEDEGITFSVKRKPSPTPSDFADPTSASRTATEDILPWKRQDPSDEVRSARPQEEFPTWVENKDYYMGYLSPTNTFLEGINPSSPVRKPSIFEIFSPVETIPESSDENQEYIESSQFASSPSCQIKSDVPKSNSSNQQQSRDTIVPFERSAKRTLTSSSWTTKPSSPEQKEEKSSLPQQIPSPDRFSITTINPADRKSSFDTCSIECPDVALDIENEGSNTKL